MLSEGTRLRSKDIGLYCSHHSQQREQVCTGLLASPPTRLMEVTLRAQMDACRCSGLYYRRTLGSGNSHVRASSKSAHCPGGEITSDLVFLAANTTLRNAWVRRVRVLHFGYRCVGVWETCRGVSTCSHMLGINVLF